MEYYIPIIPPCFCNPMLPEQGGSFFSISDIALNIKCANGGVGICAKIASSGTCGNISLTNCKLDISITGVNGACIGVSTNKWLAQYMKCNNIKLLDCEIIKLTTVAYDPEGNISYSAAIECGSAHAMCEDINVYLRDGESVDDFLKNITVGGDVDKVGTGNEFSGYKPSIGTVTWYDHTGTKIDSGTKK